MLKQHYEQQLPFTAVNMAAASQEPAPQQPHPHPNPDIASLSMQQQQQLQQQPTNLAQHHNHNHPQQQQQHEQQQGTLVSNIAPEAQLPSNGGMATHSSVIQASVHELYMNWIPLTMDTIERATAKW